MCIYELARIIRSKNAGPFTCTVDIFAQNESDFDAILGALDEHDVASRYCVAFESVQIVALKSILVIKVTIPRNVSSGSPDDTDVYGCQMHMPIGYIDIPERI